jgi:8-oxo-dGTP diphosphatase
VSKRSEVKRTRPLKPARGDRPAAIAVGIMIRGNQLLVCRRKEGAHLAGSWEFPGGKIRAGEAPADALRREVLEEVGVQFEKATLFHRKQHAYDLPPAGAAKAGGETRAARAPRPRPRRLSVDLYYFLCTGVEGSPTGKEGQEARWVSAADLDHLPTPAANADVIRMLQDQLG